MSADWSSLLRHLRRTRRAVRRDVEEEIAFGLEMRARALERRGLDPAAAREEAGRAFGDFEAARDACVASDLRRERRARRRDWLEEAAADAALAVRQSVRHPGFALAVVVSLALGIGAAVAIYTVADHVLLRPLPYAGIDAAMTVWRTDARAGERKTGLPAADFVALAERSRAMEAWGLAEPFGYDLTATTPPEPVSAWLVTAGFFRAAGIVPAMGREFTAEESAPNGPPAVILSHRFWKRTMGGDPNVLGRTLELDGAPAAIVGVLPAGADYPEPKDVFVPLVLGEDALRDGKATHRLAVARLREGGTPKAAEAELRTLLGASAAPGAGVRVVPLEQQVLGDVRPALLVLSAAVGLLLLVACANASGLLLARNAERAQELAVRAAIGAGRGRLIRQMLAENGVLAVAAGLLGTGVAAAAVRIASGALPPDLPRADALALDAPVLAFALALTALAALLTGALPALDAARRDPMASLRADGRAGVGPARIRTRRALVASQLALAVVLVIGGGLLAKSYVRLLANPAGFETAERATVQVFLWDRNPTPAQRIARADEMRAAMAALPGVTDVALASAPPFHPHRIASRSAIVRLDAPAPLPGEELRVITHVASPEYFSVLGMPIVKGRAFAREDAGGPLAAIVNQTAARRLFGGEDPLGRRVRFGVMGPPQEREIVGVVADARARALDADPEPEAYVPFAQSGTGSVTFVARARGDAEALLPALRAKVWEVDPSQTIYHSGTLEGFVAATLRARQFNLGLVGAFSALAFSLAVLGVYGVVRFSVRARLREMGVRMAVGARPEQIVRLIVGDGLSLAAPGVVVGLAAAAALTRFMRSLLYGVEPFDPASFVQLPLLVLAAAALAAWLPARRAASGDPLRALRGE
jgi:predicted permease